MIAVYQSGGLDLFTLIEKVLRQHLNCESYNEGVFKVPSDAYNPQRKQHTAMTIIKKLARKKKAHGNLKLGIVDADIYAPQMNFIFGIADPLKKTALVSTYRLAGNKFTERISKEVVHEVGHLLGLNHCLNLRCVMYFSNTIGDTDKKRIDLCRNCRNEIE